MPDNLSPPAVDEPDLSDEIIDEYQRELAARSAVTFGVLDYHTLTVLRMMKIDAALHDAGHQKLRGSDGVRYEPHDGFFVAPPSPVLHWH